MMRSLIPKSSSYLFQDLQREMNRLFEDTFGEFEIPQLAKGIEEKTWVPAIEMSEHDNEYCVKVELPGIKKEDIDLEIGENSLTIKGETEHKTEEKGENLYKSEFRYGQFTRTLAFPSEVKCMDAKADFKDGVLTIMVPKAEEVKKLNKIKIED